MVDSVSKDLVSKYSWIDHMVPFERLKYHSIKPAVEKYAEIKKLGLKTIPWEEYSAGALTNGLFHEISDFIENNGPSFFICAPKSNIAGKEYQFNLNNTDAIANWIEKHARELKNYNYLIAARITSAENGFFGTAVSNGKGLLMCETNHSPEIYSQIEAGKMPKSYNGFINRLFIDQSEVDIFDQKTTNNIWAVNGTMLTKDNILELKNNYLKHKGYFKFVKGQQHDKTGLYTIDYEHGSPLRLPEHLHKLGSDLTAIVHGAMLREGM